MATASVSYTFVNGDPNDGPQVSQNFTDLVTFLNNSVVHKDGSTTMTGALVLPASDPTTANQATRKSYVDNQSVRVFASTAARDAAITAPSEGMQVYIDDRNSLMFYDGSGWRDAISQLRMHGVVGTRASGTINISDTTTTAVAFTAEDTDTDGYHDNSTNNTRFTVPSGLGGVYYVEGSVQWTSQTGATGGVVLFIRKNGSDNLARVSQLPVGSSGTMTVSSFIPLVATDYLELCVWHSSAGTRTLGFNSTINGLDPKTPTFKMFLLSGAVA